MSKKKPLVNRDRATRTFRLGGSDFSEFVGCKLYRDNFHVILDEILDGLDCSSDKTHRDFNGLVVEPYGEPYYEVTWEGYDGALSINSYLPCYIESEEEWKQRVKSEEETLHQWEIERATEKEAKELKRIENLQRQVEQLEQTLAKKRSELES